MTLLMGLSGMLFSQKQVVIKGKIVDFITFQPLENVCIHNISVGNMAFSNSNGDFAIMATKNDTLAITRVGYDIELCFLNDSIVNSKERITIKLIVRSLMLRNVTIYAMKPYPLFVKELTKPTPHDKVDIPGTTLTPEQRAEYSTTETTGNLLRNTPLASPFTFLYNKFSHKAKMDRMYRSLVDNQEEVMRLTEKYNPQIVQRLTHLQGDDLEDFMLYCSFSYYTLSISNEVEIERMILNAFAKYKQEK
jgi:hypothetical protein